MYKVSEEIIVSVEIRKAMESQSEKMILQKAHANLIL